MKTLSKITLATVASFALLANIQANEAQKIAPLQNPTESSQDSSAISQKILDAMRAPLQAHKPSSTKSVEIDFLNDMIPHHQGTLDAAKILLPQAKNPQVALIAENIIKVQETEIGEFKELIAKKGVKTTKISAQEYQEFAEKNNKARESMLADMAIKISGDVEVDFLNAMIAHHTGSVETSNIVLSYTKDKKIQEIAKHIIDEQNTQITAIQKLIDEIESAKADSQQKAESNNSKKSKKK